MCVKPCVYCKVYVNGFGVEIVPTFHTVFAHVYHYAIFELCKGQWTDPVDYTLKPTL